ncbi:MAG: LamG domain-containing protein, partial [Candidatus Omnitrophica bacterium]|nr:LamG domain-containing protein [Candidatus Omnitrophota bacterium]
MNIKRKYTIPEKFIICCTVALHLVLVTPIAEVLPIIKEEKLIPQAHAQAANSAPVIYSLNGMGISVGTTEITLPDIEEGKTLFVEPSAYDPDGDNVTFTYGTPLNSDGNWQIPYDFLTAGTEETLTIPITASDSIDTSEVNVKVKVKNKDNTPSVKVALSEYAVKKNNPFTIQVKVDDQDLEDLSSNMVPEGRPPAYHGTSELDTAEKKFGTSSVYLDPNGGYVSLPDSEAYSFGSDKFTIDFWVRPKEDWNSGHKVLFTQNRSTTNNFQILEVTNSGNIFYRVRENENGTVYLQSNLSTPDWKANQWYHIAVIRGWQGHPNKWAITVNGRAVGTLASASTVPDFSEPMRFGYGRHTNGGYYYLNGHCDEIRVSKGIARWAGNFTLPTESCIPDQYTKLLLHFDTYSDTGGPQDENYFEPTLSINAQQLSGIPVSIYGSGSFEKIHSINSAGVYKITAEIKQITTGEVFKDETYIEITDSDVGENDVFPVSGDFNGDGIADIGTWNKQTGVWVISFSNHGLFDNVITF